MNSNVLTQTIVTGSDPRGLPEFSAIREEINKASHPSQPELNWKLVESLALAIFKANGVDLHTATYYTLARTRTQGLAGFCEGAELLAAMVSHDRDKFWPQGGPARTEMLDWFNSRTGNILRQQISFAESDLPLIYRTERALQLICDKLQQVELKRVPRVENLLYFMQNTRKRLEPQLKSNTENAAQTTVRTLIYAPETQASSTPEAVVPPLPGLPEMKVEVRSLTENPPQASVIKQGSTVRGFIAGSPVQWLSPQHCGGGRSIRCSSNCYRLTTPLRAQQRCGWPHLNSKTMSAGCNNFLIPPRYSRWKPGCR